MIVTRQGTNAVAFLLDGDAYFQRLHQTLEGIRLSGGGGTQFVRMAFWQLSPDTFLPSYPLGGGAVQPGAHLIDLLEAMARLGTPVQLIAWAGTTIVRLVNHEMASNWEMKKWVDAVNHRNAGVVGYRPIDIYMESYGGPTHIGMSTHQKIVIASDGNTKEAYVGGMNLAQKYLSRELHDPVNWWHDAAVRVTGAIVDDIEAEWMRRWSKQNPVPAPAGGIGPPAAPIFGGVTVSMMTTNIEATPPETNVRLRMLNRIINATQYIYLENYALTDPYLVSALAARKAAGLPVIPVVNHPRSRTMEGFDGFSYLMFYTYVELALANFVTLDAVDTWWAWLTRTPNVYTAAAMNARIVQKAGLNPNAVALFNPANSFRLNFTTPIGAAKTIYFRDIWGITTPAAPGPAPAPQLPVMYGPKTHRFEESRRWTYPHAKVALFDDQYVLIGTANWTYRSMQYDGEITLEIDSAAFAQGVRQQLFSHWDMPTSAAGGPMAVGANWINDALANQQAWAAGAFALSETRIVPLALDDFIYPGSLESWQRYATTSGAALSAYL